MSVATLSGASLAAAHREFEAALPALQNTIRYEFRKLPRQRRSEAIADGLAACWHCWHGLVRRGRDPLAVGPSGIARNAARYVRNGRQLGTGTAKCGGMDVFSRKAQARTGLRVVSLDQRDDEGQAFGSGSWSDWLAENNQVTPGDEACFHVDFDRWLAGLPARKREMAELLAVGYETGEVAELLCVTPSAVSQARTWLEASWRDFQGTEVVTSAAPTRRGRGRPRKEANKFWHLRPSRTVPPALDAGG